MMGNVYLLFLNLVFLLWPLEWLANFFSVLKVQQQSPYFQQETVSNKFEFDCKLFQLGEGEWKFPLKDVLILS